MSEAGPTDMGGRVEQAFAGAEDRSLADDVLELLARAPTFSQIGRKRLKHLAEEGPLVSFSTGETVFAQGDAGDFAYLVVSGELSIEVATPTGRVRVATAGVGQVVGEIAAFAETPRTASVFACVDSVLLKIRRKSIRRLLTREPEVAMTVIAQLGARLQGLNGTIATLTQATTALGKGEFDPAMLASLRSQADRFSHFADAFAAMAAELGEKQSRMSEMRAAADIQRALLPRPLAEHERDPRYEIAAAMKPAKEVGGDFYDHFMLDANRLAIAIGDVSGKGVPASLFMSVARTVIRALATAERGVAETVRLVNDQLSRDNEQCMFVTLAYAVVDLSSGLLTVAICGHEEAYALLDGAVTKLTRSGPALGLFEGARISETQVALRAGDHVILGTDGITEAFDAARRPFGTEAFETVMAGLAGRSAGEVLGAIFAAVAAHAGDAPQSDDLSCLVLTYRG